ncbi:MAG: tRNA (adenosine(37)-N6)-threonylcarbamoyltransferase complex dimerization subunit type 1 TsaB [Steroidobacteraceae bacterium]
MSLSILAIDTATEGCSAALWTPGGVIERREEAGREAALRILPLVDAVLREAGMTLGALTALAAGIGPGGFTGVRLSVAVAQGLAFGAGLPVVPVNTLEALAHQALGGLAGMVPAQLRGSSLADDPQVLTCLDARMKEIYWASYRRDAARGVVPVDAPALATPQAVEAALRRRAWPAIGRGMHLLMRQGAWPTPCDAQALPRASDMAELASLRLRSDAREAGELEPLYLRDKVAFTESERRTAPQVQR